MDTTNIKVIWSADHIPKSDLLRILGDDKFPRETVAVKLDRFFVEQNGLSAIGEVQSQCNVAVFDDAKIVEVPSKVLEIAKLHLENHPWMLNVMANACDTRYTLKTHPEISDNSYDLLYRFSKLCFAAETQPCAVTVLTNKTADTAKWEFNKDPAQAVVDYATLMENCNMTDIVCSAMEAQAIRKVSDWLIINTPGIRMFGSNTDDQNRVMTPQEAFAAGVNRLVVGRDIYRKGESYDVILPNIQKILNCIERRGQHE